MAVTGVGLQTSLYITLLLIFPPVISLLLFVALSLFQSHSLPLSLVCLSFREPPPFFPLIVVAPGDVVVLVVVNMQQKKYIFSAVLFLFFVLPQYSSRA